MSLAAHELGRVRARPRAGLLRHDHVGVAVLRHVRTGTLLAVLQHDRAGVLLAVLRRDHAGALLVVLDQEKCVVGEQ